MVWFGKKKHGRRVAVPIVEGLAIEEFVLYCTFANYHPQGYRVHENWVVKEIQVYTAIVLNA
jgi:hypothetical protein